MRTAILGIAGTAVCLMACSDPTLTRHPSFSTEAQAACPAAADFIVSTEDQLVSAIASANPGATIAVDGMIAIHADVNVSTPSITLTCATPGSGLFAQAGAGVVVLLSVAANDVTVDRLSIDGGNAEDVFQADGATGVRFTNNSVLCSPALNGGGCSLFNATPGAIPDAPATADGAPASTAPASRTIQSRQRSPGRMSRVSGVCVSAMAWVS